MTTRGRWWLAGVGGLLALLWFASQAATVVPVPGAREEQWVAGNALAFLAGLALGAAAVSRSRGPA